MQRNMTKSGGKRVVLVACPLEGHMTPILQLGTMLHSKGFSITVAHTKFNSPNPQNNPDFTFIRLPDNLSGIDTSFFNLLAVISAINKNCKDSLQSHLAQMIENQDKEGPVACVIYDPLMYFTDAVANQLKIPSLIFRSTNAAYLKALRVTIQLHKEMTGLLPASRLLEAVPGLDPLRFTDLPIPLHIPVPEIIVQFQVNLIETRSSLAYIWNTADELEDSDLSELKQHYEAQFFTVGPFHKMVPPSSTTLMEEDRNCIEWLSKQAPNSVVYISLGSLAMLDSKDLVEMAWGLANSEQPFLWVIRPGSIKGSKWIENLPEEFLEKVGPRGQIVTWAPQKEVLSHSAVGAFWSHCGWNSTLECICEGLPIICRPCFADQRVNARYLTHVWKIGILLENSTDRVTIEKSIRKVMVDEEGKEMRQNAVTLKEQLDSCVHEGGSSCKSLDSLAEFIVSLTENK